MLPIIPLPGSLRRSLETTFNSLLHPRAGRTIDFCSPPGEEALIAADSISWRIFKNPIGLLIGGIAAVVLELAEPSVRTAVWKHSSFRTDPLGRLQRTGLAAMVTVYGARSIAEPMIARVVRMHARVAGETPCGVEYAASDARLLSWVQATASFGFAHAYSRYVAPLTVLEMDTLFREGTPASRLYGALHTPRSTAESHALFESMRGTLEPSTIVFEFLQIMHQTAALPAPLRWMQPMLIRAAVDLIPDWIRDCLGLDSRYGLHPRERWVVKLAGAVADRIVLPESPASQACRRLGLPRAYLYSRSRLQPAARASQTG